jgi:hypothetical protein
MLRLAGIDAAAALAVDFLCGGVGLQEAAFRAAARSLRRAVHMLILSLNAPMCFSS